MKLIEAIPKLREISGIPFSKVLKQDELNQDLIIPKGRTGQILQDVLGIDIFSQGIDFEDGELKTNRCYPNGKPKETMFICQITKIIDLVLNLQSFKETYLFNKIKNLLYVPVCKQGPKENWHFLPCIHFNLEEEKNKLILHQIEIDYYNICNKLNDDINNKDGFIHTSSGDFIQIRSKDAKPYNAIYSKKYEKYISNKNHAFYFKKEFMQHLQSLSPEYPFSLKT